MPETWTHIDLEQVGSTSSHARDLIQAASAPLPFVVTARRQTAGRGQRASRWFSDEGSLTCTLGLDPAGLGLSPTEAPRIALAAAVAIVESLAPFTSPGDLGIRWPNDVEARGRKLAGLLPEVVPTSTGSYLALGIGLNLTTNLDQAPPEVRLMATSVLELTGTRLDARTVLATLLPAVVSCLRDLSLAPERLAARWNQLDNLREQVITLRPPVGPPITGRAQGITAEGGLLVLSHEGPRTLYAGQVLRQV